MSDNIIISIEFQLKNQYMKRTHLKSINANKESHHIQLMIFVCLGFLLYLKTFGHNWTFDDYFVIFKNQDIRSLKDFIINEYPGRPLRELSLMLDYKLFGLNSKYWHIQNILIHSINAWLIYVLLMNMSRSKSLSWMSSLLFLVHPIQVEVVVQSSHRKDSLCLLFILLSFYSYVLFRNNKGIIYIYVTLCAFALSLLAKQSAFAFPLVIISYEILFYNTTFSKKITYKYLFCTTLIISSALIFIFLYMQYFDLGSKSLLFSSNVVDDYSIGKYYATVFSGWGFIIAKLFWPFGLSVNYLIAPPEVLLDYRLVFLAIFIILMAVTAYYAYHKSKLLLFFLFWFVVFFLPTSNVLPFTKHFVADRYLYIPSVGLCVAIAILLKSFFLKSYIFVSLFIVFAFSLITFYQIDVWKDNLSLWENSLKYNPYSVRAIMNVALNKYSDNDELFLENIHNAISINSYDPFPYNSLASFYYEKNEHMKAIENYEKFIELINKQGVSMYKDFYVRAKERLIEMKEAGNK